MLFYTNLLLFAFFIATWVEIIIICSDWIIITITFITLSHFNIVVWILSEERLVQDSFFVSIILGAKNFQILLCLNQELIRDSDMDRQFYFTWEILSIELFYQLVSTCKSLFCHNLCHESTKSLKLRLV
jgi:hypothetical protein